MASQTVNNILWTKLFLEYGISGLAQKAGVSRGVLYSIKNGEVPSGGVQRKLRDGLELKIEEMFPITFANTEPNKEAA